MKTHDYENLDEAFLYQYKKDRQHKAEQLGYQFISQCVVEEYRKLKSLNKVAVKLEVTQACISYELKKFNEPRQPRGGYRPGDKRHGQSNWDKKIRTGKFFHI